MNKRSQRPNLRMKCKFYVFGPTSIDSPEVNEYGELIQEFSLHSAGYFAKEKPKKPREIREGDRVQNEQEFLLIGNWTGSLAKVENSMFCFIPTLRKLFAVNGSAIDPMGDRKKLHIYIVDNVSQDIRTKMPGATL